MCLCVGARQIATTTEGVLDRASVSMAHNMINISQVYAAI